MSESKSPPGKAQVTFGLQGNIAGSVTPLDGRDIGETAYYFDINNEYKELSGGQDDVSAGTCTVRYDSGVSGTYSLPSDCEMGTISSSDTGKLPYYPTGTTDDIPLAQAVEVSQQGTSIANLTAIRIGWAPRAPSRSLSLTRR